VAIANVQVHYRFRTDASSVETAPTWGAAEDTTFAPSPQRGTKFRLRFEIQNTGSTTTGAVAWRIFCSRNSGAYAQVTTSGTYVQDADASSDADDATLSTRRLTSAAGTFTAGKYDESGVTSNITMGASSVTELEFGLVFTNAVVKGDTYDFRVYRATSTALETYTVTPRVTITHAYLDATVIGTYALSGVAATLTKQNKLPCAVGAYVLSIDDTITRDYGLSCNTGAFTYTGSTAAFAKSGGSPYTFVASVGSFVLSIDDQVTRDYGLTCAVGSLSLTGGATVLTKAGARTLVALAGSYTLSGIPTTFDVKMPAVTGSLVLTGQAMTPRVTVPAVVGTYTLSGVAASFFINRKLICNVGALSLSGVSATFDVKLPSLVGSYVLSGIAAAITVQRQLSCVRGQYALTGIAATVAMQHKLSCVVGSYVSTGVGTVLGVGMPAVVGTYALNGIASGLTVQRKSINSVGAYSLTGIAASLSKTTLRTLVCAGGVLNVNGIAAGLSRTTVRTIVSSTGSYSLNGVGSTFGISMPAVAGSYALVGPATLFGVGMPAIKGGYSLNGVASLFKSSRTATVGSYSLTGPTTFLVRSRVMTAVQGSYVLNIDDVVTRDYGLAAVAGSYLLTGRSIANILSARRGIYSLSGSAATLTKFGTTKVIVAQTGNYVLNIDDVVTRDFGLACATGSLVLTGKIAAINKGVQNTLPCLTGAYNLALTSSQRDLILGISTVGNIALSGKVAGLARQQRTLLASPGTYALIGNAANIHKGGSISYTLNASGGTYVWNIDDIVTLSIGVTVFVGSYSIVSGNTLLSKGQAPGTYLLPCATGVYITIGSGSLRDLAFNSVSGSYVLSGKIANLVANHSKTLAANPGSYMLNGVAVNLSYLKKITANRGIYDLVGHVALAGRASFTINGSYTLTGRVAALQLAHRVSNIVGTYTLTGSAATLQLNRMLSAVAGSYTLTGGLAFAKRRMVAQSRSYVVTGIAANIMGGRFITSLTGSYSLNGNTALAQRRVALNTGTYVLSSVGAIFQKVGSYAIGGVHGTYTLAGQPILFRRTYLFSASAGSYVLAGQTSGFGISMPAVVGHYTLTGTPALFSVGMPAVAGNYIIIGNAAQFKASRIIASVVGHYGLNGQAVNFVASHRIAANLGTYSLAGTVTQLRRSKSTLTAVAGNYVVSGKVAGLGARGISLDRGIYTFSVHGLTSRPWRNSYRLKGSISSKRLHGSINKAA
jgi:hypothetical protein